MDPTCYTSSFYEQQIKKKLIERGDTRYSPQQNLLRIFKFVDLQNSGRADLNCFTKAMAKLGVIFNNGEEVNSLFQTYDNDKNGYVQYDQLCTYLFQKKEEKVMSRQVQAEQQQAQHQQNMARGGQHLIGHALATCINKIKKEIFRKKMGINLINMEIMLYDFDPKRNQIKNDKVTVSQNEVIQAAKNLGLGLNVFDLQHVFEHLDASDRGFVFVHDLMTLLKSRFNAD